VGKCRIRPWPGKNSSAALGTTKARAPRKDRYGSKPTRTHIQTLALLCFRKVTVPSLHETPHETPIIRLIGS
jgi:hypothetical protein